MDASLTPTALSPQAGGKRPAWFRDFAWRDGCLLVCKTGIELHITPGLVSEILSWTVWLAILGATYLQGRLTWRQRLSIWYAPDRPRPWYLCRGAAMFAGIDVAPAATNAHATFYFDDVSTGQPPTSRAKLCINFGCNDISKSYVARIFEAVAGYPLALDPRQALGEIVEKSDKNGVHDGRIVTCPLDPQPGKVYQRVVDTRDDDGCCRDLRTPCIGGEPVVVWIKTKTPDGRFSINNRHAAMAEPQDVFSEDELDLIRRFTARVGLDCGGLDILRDRHDGRIYIVDVNKTDVGPVIALSWGDKIRSMARLGRALRQYILKETT